ncbi:uncharacterized protein HMPREF1541_10208 [Cyphellophora europaea CBS 101466]|uniref:Heterokaryon incompatibility domain-containing protein n=1 Tax=Cyphellophora europaea (strain CBS 101466) TaxID=1220924 RepID=W2S935_CYPE1|nr:uncharacterized protein HMPREF1541_10208 [Cyphellophora europaea CBS 101466]ETN44538.1 hypothetical protein HMPREF1541_10208 [Cyphellophora europaea CBS 101466]
MDRFRGALRNSDRRWSLTKERSSSQTRSFQVHDVKKLPDPIIALYKYAPIGHRELRLVELQPAGEDNAKEIHCKIQYCSLDSCPLFTAVSYTWGPASTPEIVYVEGKVLKIRKNLFRVLRDLRRDEPRLLWIDALCINQHDLEERMEQVKIMGDIYARANYVMSWLGGDFKDPHLAANILDRYARELPLPPDTDEHAWKSIEELYTRDTYWSRRWIVQEILQGNSVVIHVAGFEFSLTTMGEFALDNTFPWPQDSYATSVRVRLRQTLPVQVHEQRLGRRQLLTMTELLLAYRDTQCADPHDTVFALLSLTPRIAAHINAGYETSIIDLMVEVLRISCRLESLPPHRIISFAAFLRRQFEIDQASLHDHITQFQASGAQPLQGLKAEVRVRGVATSHLSVKQEQVIVTTRAKARPLYQLDAIPLEGNLVEGVYRMSRRRSSLTAEKSVRVSSQDLCAFGWQSPEGNSFFGSNNPNVGLATTPIQYGDEVWQFQDTDVALIIRHHNTGCSAVGRAQLYQKPPHLDRLPSSEVERNFLSRAWRGNAPAGSTRNIQLDVPLLLQLILWVEAGTE